MDKAISRKALAWSRYLGIQNHSARLRFNLTDSESRNMTQCKERHRQQLPHARALLESFGNEAHHPIPPAQQHEAVGARHGNWRPLTAKAKRLLQKRVRYWKGQSLAARKLLAKKWQSQRTHCKAVAAASWPGTTGYSDEDTHPCLG